MTAIALARIDLPPGTTNITAGMITDLRTIANPRRLRAMYRIDPPGGNRDLSQGAFTAWPVEGTHNVGIPAWASYAMVHGIISGAKVISAAYGAKGYARVAVPGAADDTGNTYMNFDPVENNNRVHVPAFGRIDFPLAVRGTTQAFRFEAMLTEGVGSGCLRADGNTNLWLDIEFCEDIV
jgi:hypothetical protein